MTKLRRIEPMSLAKFKAVFLAISGFFYGVLNFLLAVMTTGKGPVAMLDIVFGPILGLIAGFVGGLIFAYIYNFVADFMGGVEIELK